MARRNKKTLKMKRLQSKPQQLILLKMAGVIVAMALLLTMIAVTIADPNIGDHHVSRDQGPLSSWARRIRRR